jgi:hypothetical protein
MSGLFNGLIYHTDKQIADVKKDLGAQQYKSKEVPRGKTGTVGYSLYSWVVRLCINEEM